MPLLFRYGGGRTTKTGLALEYARQVGFQYSRKNAVKVLLLMTDGKSDDRVENAANVRMGVPEEMELYIHSYGFTVIFLIFRT